MALSQLAGNGTEGTFVDFQLYAGESDIITGNEVVSGGVAYAQYTVMGRRADGLIVAWMPGTADESGVPFATGTLTFAGQPVAAETITINAVPITWIANAAVPVGNQVALGVDAHGSAVALANFLNLHVPTFAVDAAVPTGTGTVVILTAETAGAAGNAIALAKSGANPTLSAATLAGGADTAGQAATESRPMCILAQPVDASLGDVPAPVFTGGVFNHVALVWPASVTTELARKKAFDRSHISVKALK